MRRMIWGGALLLAGALAVSAAVSSYAASAYDWRLPPGVAPPPVPAGNPMSAAKVALGRRLFYDADLSVDGTTSCATCHEQHRAFTEGNPTHPGVGGVPGRRNVMGLANVAWFDPLTWADSTRRTLEDQILVPLDGTHPVEMGMGGRDKELARRLADDSCYRRMFAAAFPESGGRIDRDNTVKAIAAFERTLISYDSPYDRYRRGAQNAISPSAKRGAALFDGKGNCSACHSGTNFTDLKFHNIGLYNVNGKGAYPARDPGLIEISGAAKDEGAIRTPTLRNVAYTGPYMHDGSVASLAEAIRRHLDGANPLRDPLLSGVRLTKGDEADLVAFLQSLSDTGFVTNPGFALPGTACGKPNY